MKNKAPLPLMEQMIMILVFALTAVLCLQGFSLASTKSHRQEAKTHAMLEVQNTAELVKHYAGDYARVAEHRDGTIVDVDGEKRLYVSYNDSWEVIPYDAASDYTMTVTPAKTTSDLLGAAHITLFNQETTLFSLTVTWQIPSEEVVPHV